MSFRYTSDIQLSELQSKLRPLDKTETILIVQDGKSVQCSLLELINDLSISTTAVYVDWALLQNVPALSGATKLTAGASGQSQAVEVPQGQVSHFVDITMDASSTLDLILPSVSSEVPLTGVQVTIRGAFPAAAATLNVREGSVANSVIATESSVTQAYVWTALFAHNGISWKYVPLESLTL